MIKLSELEIGKHATITTVGGSGSLRQHFLDMGVIPGARVQMVKHAPLGDPVEVRIHGYELTLRLADCAEIGIDNVEDDIEDNAPRERRKHTAHPGLGEMSKNHDKSTEHPLPDSVPLTFALVGNQNSGKTTLFNQLTGSNQHVGNFPGVTVDRKDGHIRGHENAIVTDLPGIYSLSPYSAEEIITREFVLKENIRGIINIVDATNIERNLYLTMQLIELDIPMVVALNMMDEVRENGGTIDVNALENMLGVPVVPISAAKNEGIEELVEHAVHVAKYQEKPTLQDFCSAEGEGAAVHRALHGIMHMIEDHTREKNLPVRFAASKLAVGDSLMERELSFDENETETLEHIRKQMEKERGLDRAAAIADMRFSFIQKVSDTAVIKPRESKEHIRSQKIDRILTGKYTAIPMFVLIMALVFWLTFGVIGAFLQGVLEDGIGILGEWVGGGLEKFGTNSVLISLIVDGIFGGVGAVVSFMPIIVTLFFFLSLLEDSGYMARVAFVMDKLLRRIGLSGRSIVPMLIGFGCTVPGVMAARTLPSERDRRMTILITPFMSCSAKLPVYAFFASAFFPKYSTLVMIALYFGGMVVGILISMILRKTAFKGEAVPFVMELPNYRMPGIKNVSMLLWEKAKDFLERAFTIIFVATIVIWALQTFDIRFNVVEDSSESILAMISGIMAPIFKPLGFGDWRVTVSLITGVIAKESVVATLAVLFGSVGVLNAVLTPLTATSLLVFCLLYSPCIAAVASVKRELGGKWALYVAFGNTAVAYIAALAIRLIGMAFGLV